MFFNQNSCALYLYRENPYFYNFSLRKDTRVAWNWKYTLEKCWIILWLSSSDIWLSETKGTAEFVLFRWSEGLILVKSSSLVLHIIAMSMCGFHDYSFSFSIPNSCFLKVENQWGHWFSSRPKGLFIPLKFVSNSISPSLNTILLFGCWGSRKFIYVFLFFFLFVVVNWYFPLCNYKPTSIDHILLTLYNCRASLNSSMIKGNSSTRFLNKWQQPMKLMYQRDSFWFFVCVSWYFMLLSVFEIESFFCQGILILYKQNQYIENIVL